VLADWGAKKAGYHSDLTRTFFLGTIPGRLREIHGLVAEAQSRAISRIAPGVPFKAVDEAAREVIRQGGCGAAFGHSTGHGLGLEVHEPPALSARAEGEFLPGMVVTVEPGVYFPGECGVRFEDDVLVTPGGRRVLSRLKRSLRWKAV
jgi:Xaa-Pro aminopeptidase